MPPIKLTVIAPVFNEEAIIETFHARLREVLSSMNDVVDRCTDNTLEVLRVIAQRDSHARVLSLSSRFGHQMSLVAGIDHALEADAIVMMDSDMQHPPEIIPELLDNFRRGFEVVYTVRHGTEKINPLRNLAGNAFYRLLASLSSTPINSNAADFRLISRRVAKILSTDFRERNLFLRGLFSWIGFRQTYVVYVARERAGGYSKYSVSKTLQLAVAGILSFSTKPLQLGIFVGALFSLLSAILVLWNAVEFFLDKTIPSGWTTLVVLLSIYSGIQLVVLGIVGTYIGGIYEEVKNRPRYIIEEEIKQDESR